MKKSLTLILVGILLGSTVAFATSKFFSDVPDDEWYSDAVASLSEKGIINGYPDGTFGPTNNVNRAELAVILYRLIDYLENGEVAQNYGEISYSGDELLLPKQECTISSSEGGGVEYSLSIDFIDESKSTFNNISFAVYDSEDKNNLLTTGSHAAGGGQGFSYMLESSTFSWILEPEEMAIIIETIDVDDNDFSAEGYIDIKKKIEKEYPESKYLNAQKIYFKCEEGNIY